MARRSKSYAPTGVPLYTLSEGQKALLAKFRMEGNVAVFTGTEQVPNWKEIKYIFVKLLGGKWTRKGFLFPGTEEHPEALLASMLATGVLEDATAAGYFPTPDWLADKLVAEAEVLPSDRVLEPSAGQGSLIRALHRASPGHPVDVFELIARNRAVLSRIPSVNTLGDDFLRATPQPVYDVVLMNPPFAGGADVDHVTRARAWLKPEGGVIASILSGAAEWRRDKKFLAFREHLGQLGARYLRLPEKTFKESGTGVRSSLAILRYGNRQPQV